MNPSLRLKTQIPQNELPSCSSQTLVPPVSSPISPQDYDPSVNAKPYSPFYRHATLNFAVEQSIDQPTKPTRPPTGLDGTQDLESAPSLQKQSEESQKSGASKLWAQRQRRCGYLHSLTRKQRMVVKAVVAVVIVGSMVAIALGITVAVGGGVWKSDHQQGAINV